MRNKFIIFLLALIFVLLLSSCSGAVELQETGIVMGIALDLAEDDKSLLEIAVEVANYSKESGNQGSSSQQNSIFKAKGKTVTDAINNLNAKIDKYLFWGHNKVIIFGESLLQGGINQYIDAFIRNAEMRPTAYVIAAEGKAADLFEGKAGLAGSVSLGIAGLLDKDGLQTLNKKMGCNVHQFSEMMLNVFPAAAIPLLGVNEEQEKSGSSQDSQSSQKQGENKKEIEFRGYAVISSEGKAVKNLSAQEQLGMYIWRDKLESEMITVKSGEQEYSAEIYSPELKLSYENKHFAIELEVDCKMFEAFISDAVNDQLDSKRIADAFSDELRSAISAAFQAEKDSNTDFLELGQHIHRYNHDELADFSDFPAELSEPEINVKVNVVFSGEIYNSI